MRNALFAIVLLLCFCCAPLPCRAAEALPDKQLELVDFEGINVIVGQSDNESVRNLDLATLARQAISGELDLSPVHLADMLITGLAGEAAGLLSMLRHMVLLALLGAVFKELSASFRQKGVSELGFYVHFLLMLSVLLSSFSLCLGITQSLVGELCAFMLAAQPVLIGLVTASGNVAAAFAFAPLLLSAVNIIAFFIDRLLAPVITMAAVLQIVNCLSERAGLEKLSLLLQNGLRWALGLTATAFVAVLSIQRISAPAANTAVARTAKLAVNAIPVVGATLVNAVDTVAVWSGAVRSGVMIAVVLALVLLCAVPLLKLAAFALVYKLTAALLQPISDPRIGKAVDAAGSFAGLLLGAAAVVSVMFIFMIMLMLSV